MKNIIKPAIVLSLTILFSIVVVFYTRKITYPYILKHQIEEQNRAFEKVLPGYSISEELTAIIDGGEKFTCRVGTKLVDGVEKKGYSFISLIYGYNVVIKAIVGVDENNNCLGISIIQQIETPGSGSGLIGYPGKEMIRSFIPGNINSKELFSEPWFQDQFRGINVNNNIKILNRGYQLNISKDELLNQNAIAVTTGATMTTKAFIDGLKNSQLKLKKARLILEPAVIIEQNNIERVK